MSQSEDAGQIIALKITLDPSRYLLNDLHADIVVVLLAERLVLNRLDDFHLGLFADFPSIHILCDVLDFLPESRVQNNGWQV